MINDAESEAGLWKNLHVFASGYLCRVHLGIVECSLNRWSAVIKRGPVENAELPGTVIIFSKGGGHSSYA